MASETFDEFMGRFEREEFGTNDFDEILDAIRQREQEQANARLTGMLDEQAEWEEGGEDNA